MANAATNIGIALAGVGLYKKVFGDTKPGSTAAPVIKFVGEGDTDYRARLRVPLPIMISNPLSGPDSLQFLNHGIVFPYTPSISYETSAHYSEQMPMHSNFAQHFYKGSSVSKIMLTAKFTVQNDTDAGMYLAAVHLLKVLTRMKTGNDGSPGNPPPICRLDAYGNYMIKNVPVAVGGFKIDLHDSVDYYRITKALPNADGSEMYTSSYDVYGQNFVPISSTISITLIPMYSRQEMLDFSVDNFGAGYYNQAADGDGNTGSKGYL